MIFIPRLIQRFFGCLGPQGPLPLHLTDYAFSRIQHHGDHTFSRFLDVFHHRMTTLFYLAWARVRPTVNFDLGSKDRFGEYVSSSFGLGMTSLMSRDAVPDQAKRHFAGLLSCQTKHAEGLLAILQAYFQLPVDLETWVGQWIELPEDCQCRMGTQFGSGQLGQTLAIGSHVWDCQQKFRVIFGPLDLDEFHRMLPLAFRYAETADILEDDTEGEFPAADQQSDHAPDAIFWNGRIFTGLCDAPWADAVAVPHGPHRRCGE